MGGRGMNTYLQHAAVVAPAAGFQARCLIVVTDGRTDGGGGGGAGAGAGGGGWMDGFQKGSLILLKILSDEVHSI